MDHRPTRWKLAALLIPLSFLSGCDNRFLGGGEDTSADDVSRAVYALGRLEPAGGIISISAIPGERLQKLDADVKENNLVPANGILGLLASYDLGRAQLHALKTKLELAGKKRAQDLQLIKAQRAQAEAAKVEAEAKQSALPLQKEKLDLLKEASKLASAEHQRMYELSQADPDLVNPHQLAKKKNEMDLAKQEQKIAAERLESAKDAAAKAVAAAEENIQVAELSEEQLKKGFDTMAIEQEIAVAEETLKRSVLLSPHVSAKELDNVLDIECKRNHPEDEDQQATDERPYTVLKVFLRPGEFITQTPIVQVGDLRSMVCIAEVYEADVKELKEKQGVTIRSPSFSGKFADGPVDEKTGRRSGGMRGTVQRISRIIAPPGVQSRNPLAPADRSVVEVRISLDDPKAVDHAKSFVGMDVTVEFDEDTADKQDTAGKANDTSTPNDSSK